MADPDAAGEACLTRKEEAYRKILEIVLSGDLSGGERLNEQKLAEAFGMSRAPVREALLMLCSENILCNIPRLGYEIVPISLREILDAIDLRLLLETESVRLACRNRNPASLALLRSMLAREREIQEDEEDIHSWILKGDQVHQSIAEASGNVILKRCIIMVIDLLRRASIQLILEGKNRPEGIHYHRAVLEAVLSGNEEEAVNLIRQDVLILKDLIMRK
ncbi:MAG: GntR family transcriptional regulator [Spirochaetes bacterium]|nr:GntR family transcriptional regulator [Spirochaetota bacterium]